MTELQNRRRLGTGHAAPVGIDQPFEGILVVASDGLFRSASGEVITAALLEPTAAQCVSALTKNVLTPRGTLLDDLGICVCRRW